MWFRNKLSSLAEVSLYLLNELSLSLCLSLSPLTLHSASVATAPLLIGSNLNSQDSVLPVRETFSLLTTHAQLQSLWMFLKWTDNAWWCARSFSLHRAHFATLSSAYCYNEWMVADGYIFLRFAPNLMLIWAGNMVLNATLFIKNILYIVQMSVTPFC